MLEKEEASYIVGGDVNWYNHCGEHCGRPLKTKNKTTYDPAIPLLGIYSKKTIFRKVHAPQC